MKTILLFFTYWTLSVFPLSAQQWTAVSKAEAATVLMGIQQWFINHPNYAVQVKHSMYEGLESEQPSKHYSGFMKAYGKSYYSQMIGIETMQNEHVKITIDSSSRVMMISNPSQWLLPLTTLPDSVHLGAVASCSTRTIGNKLYLRLDYKRGQKVIRNEFVTNEDARLEEMTIVFNNSFYDNKMKESIDEENPKLLIQYSDYTETGPAEAAQIFNESKFIIFSSDNTVKPGPAYANVRLIDGRLKK